jgi:tRNA nucleotidyltransferase (CCA-adding enzyme)
VSARIEFYEHPTALPEVERGSIKLDLHRRDFTINTLAIGLNPDNFGDLLDFWGGERDLQDRLVRVLHSISFVDDPTRILRAVRLEQRLDFQLEPRTRELIEHALPLLERVSGDRVRHELDLILVEAEPEKMLRRLAGLEVLPHIDPALAWDDWLERKFAEVREPAALSTLGEGADVAPDRISLRYALLAFRLEASALESLLARLKLSRHMAGYLRQVIDLRSLLPRLASPMRPSQVVRLLDDYEPRALAAAWIASDEAPARAALSGYLTYLRWVNTSVDGNTLKAVGLKPGPQFGRILRTLRDAWLDGHIQDEEGERRMLEELVNVKRET